MFCLYAVSRGQKLTDHILIGTPGTMLDWAVKVKVLDMKKVDVFVLDEADVMIDKQGHQDQSIKLQRWAIDWSCISLLATRVAWFIWICKGQAMKAIKANNKKGPDFPGSHFT